MRKTLENFYYGNIIPFEQQMAASSDLRRAANKITQCERSSQNGWEKLSRRYSLNWSKPSLRSTASQRWRISSWVSGWVSE